MSLSIACLANEHVCVGFVNILCDSVILMLGLSVDSPCSNLGNTKMLLLTATKMSEFMTIRPSHFECRKSTILVGLRQMYINSSCSNLGIGIKISNISVNPAIIDPNEGFCITRCTFLLSHIIPKARDKLKKPTRERFYVFSFNDTEEKVAVKF